MVVLERARAFDAHIEATSNHHPRPAQVRDDVYATALRRATESPLLGLDEPPPHLTRVASSETDLGRTPPPQTQTTHAPGPGLRAQTTPHQRPRRVRAGVSNAMRTATFATPSTKPPRRP